MKINNKLSNFEIKSKKSTLEKEISEYENQKSEKLFELGIRAYDQIRRGLLDEAPFRELCFDIKKLDLEIYNRMLDINELEGHSDAVVCECGAILKKDDKFCKECGRKAGAKKETMLCSICASEIEADSNFCVCCGSKIEKIVENNIVEEESIEEKPIDEALEDGFKDTVEEDIENNIFEEEVEVFTEDVNCDNLDDTEQIEADFKERLSDDIYKVNLCKDEE